MASHLDDVVIQRAVSNRNRRNQPESTRSRKKSKADEPLPAYPTSRASHILAILLALSAILFLLAMVSYTARDEAMAELSVRDIIGVLRADEAVQAKVDITHNWLGLLGAVLSNFLFNFTCGISSFTLPVLMILWAKDVFINGFITRKTIQRSFLITICCFIIAAIFGTIQLISWMPTIPREWSGMVGQFLSGVFSSFLGSVGAFLVFSASLFIFIAITIDVNIHTTIQRTIILIRKLQDWSAQTWDKIKSYDKQTIDDSSLNQSSTKSSTSQQNTIEPARMVRNALANSEDESDSKRPLQEAKIVRHNTDLIDSETGEILPVTKRANKNGILKRNKIELEEEEILEPEEYDEEIDETELDTEYDEEYDSDNDEIDDDHELYDDESTIGVKPLTMTVEEVELDDEEVELEQTNIYDEEIDYTSPGLDLLEEQPMFEEVNNAELRMNAQLLQEKLETFKITIEDLVVTPGPVITQYEFVPAAGIKISQIENLTDDIALALKARGIRIIAPIPGKGTVGIEIPNHKPSMVYFSSIIKSKTFNDNDKLLPLALGKTIIGEVYCADLAKMPHLMIAGSTGSGKSVGINTILMSLLYRMNPRDLKFVIIDPKRVEMTLYKELKYHYMAASPDIDETIITNPQSAVIVLKSLCVEMDKRYDLLASVGLRNLVEYNKRATEGTLKDKEGKQLRPLPYIVTIIDELADLMITARNEVETPIIRLAQMARAIGIHLIIATQRPSVDVITGIIKTNFPARIAYQVAQKVDSRTIIDTGGAEQLLGNGDMLFTRGGEKPIRLQNSFISTEEVEAVTDFIARQQGYSTPYMLPSLATQEGIKKEMAADRDVLFYDAGAIVIQHQQASVSLLQRRLKIGFSRAGRIMDELEAAGVVGPFDGSKARSVRMESPSELESI